MQVVFRAEGLGLERELKEGRMLLPRKLKAKWRENKDYHTTKCPMTGWEVASYDCRSCQWYTGISLPGEGKDGYVECLCPPRARELKEETMKIDKAIEILQKDLRSYEYEDCQEFKDALKLGIEALKRVRDTRVGRLGTISYPLPGETEEKGWIKSLLT